MVETLQSYEKGTENKGQNWFWEGFFQVDVNSVFEKNVKNVRKHGNIELREETNEETI